MQARGGGKGRQKGWMSVTAAGFGTIYACTCLKSGGIDRAAVKHAAAGGGGVAGVVAGYAGRRGHEVAANERLRGGCGCG